MAHGLRVSVACGIHPDQGLNLCLLHRQVDSLPLSPQGSPGFLFLRLPLVTWGGLVSGTRWWRGDDFGVNRSSETVPVTLFLVGYLNELYLLVKLGGDDSVRYLWTLSSPKKRANLKASILDQHL